MKSQSKTRVAIRCSAIFAIVLVSATHAFAEWKEKVLYSFQGIPDGANPAGGVVFDKAGNLYGATSAGGAKDCISITQCGTVYQLTPPAKQGDPWTETVLHIFRFVGNQNDGDGPEGGVTLDNSGNLYGTTAYGGTGNCQLFGSRVGCGTVYEMTPPKQKGGKWTEKVIYSFQSGKDGYFPWGDLTWDKQGNLYGATQYGGGYGSCNAPYYQYCGTVFMLSPPKTKSGKWTEQVLYAFKGIQAGKQFGDGANPNGGLAFDSKGAIYGTTYIGGYNCPHNSNQGCGTAFKLTSPGRVGGSWTERKIYVFKGSDGEHPPAGMTFDSRGNLYGTTVSVGVVFKLARSSRRSDHWIESILHTFNCESGCDPEAGVIFDKVGNLYGTTYSAQSVSGTVFRLQVPKKGQSWTYSLLYGFTGPPDGAQPASRLLFDSGGKLYGTTEIGGTGSCGFYGCGIVFNAEP